MSRLEELLNANTDLLWTAIVAAIVSAAVSYFFRTRETRHRLETEYEYEQRKKLRDLIARYHGRLLNAANSLNYRFWNLYANHEKGWLNVRGTWSPERYYFLSFVFRFLNVCALVRAFEKEAVFVDARIAKRRDFQFLQYLAALRWCMTDVALFEGLEYDNFDEVDHFFSDTFRQYCDAYIQSDGSALEFEAFTHRVQTDRSFDPVLRFFDSLGKSEQRLRWDRLVAFHLLLVAFINIIGYPEHRTSQSKMNNIAQQARHRSVLTNLASWLPRHGLKGCQARRIRLATRRAIGAG
jgi:hypothetical protein